MSGALPNLKGEKLENYEVLDTISRGSFGAVYKVLDENNGKMYAMKVLYPDDANKKNFEKEVNVHELLSREPYCNESITCLHDSLVLTTSDEIVLPNGEVVEEKLNFYLLILELMDGEFWDIIEAEIVPSDAKMALYFFKLLLEGLNFIHQQGLAHNDIKPENILYRRVTRVDAEGKEYTKMITKFADFGFTCTDESHPELLPYVGKCLRQGSPEYISPDFWDVDKAEDVTLELAQKDDIWALGTVFRLLTVGRYPIAGINDLIERKPNYNYRDIQGISIMADGSEPMDYNTGQRRLDEIINVVVDHMSKVDADERPTAKELLDFIISNE
jgi:serine/threonine protein kinase